MDNRFNVGPFWDLLNHFGENVNQGQNNNPSGRGVDHNDDGVPEVPFPGVPFAMHPDVDPYTRIFAMAGPWNWDSPNTRGWRPRHEGPGRRHEGGHGRRGGRRRGGPFGRYHWYGPLDNPEDAAATPDTAPPTGEADSANNGNASANDDRSSTAAESAESSSGAQTPTTSTTGTATNDNQANDAPDPAEVFLNDATTDPYDIGLQPDRLSRCGRWSCTCWNPNGSCTWRPRARRGGRGRPGQFHFDLPHRGHPRHARGHHAHPQPPNGSAGPHPPPPAAGVPHPPPHGGPHPPPPHGAHPPPPPHGAHPPPPYSGAFHGPGVDVNHFLHTLSQGLGEHVRGLAQVYYDTNNQDNTESDNNSTSFSPPVDIFNIDHAYILHVALPGARKEDIGVDWDQDAGLLRIAGVVHRPGGEDFIASLAYSERQVGMFERSVALPPALPAGLQVEEEEEKPQREEIDSLGITARMEDGILIVTVPKLEKEWTEVRKVDVE